MKIEISRNAGVITCAVFGELDMYAVPALHEAYEKLSFGAGERALLVDLVEASYIDSSGIGALFRMYSDAREKGLGFCVYGVKGMVEKLFALSRMSSIIPVERDASQALRRLGAVR